VKVVAAHLFAVLLLLQVLIAPARGGSSSDDVATLAPLTCCSNCECCLVPERQSSGNEQLTRGALWQKTFRTAFAEPLSQVLLLPPARLEKPLVQRQSLLYSAPLYQKYCLLLI
jgi:hypothetical protein